MKIIPVMRDSIEITAATLTVLRFMAVALLASQFILVALAGLTLRFLRNKENTVSEKPIR